MPSPTAAAIDKYVPASIRSGIMVCVHPCKLSTPSTRMMLVPAPLILAPILFSKFTTSIISGSRAAFSIMVFPFARTDASNMLIVAPTDTTSI